MINFKTFIISLGCNDLDIPVSSWCSPEVRLAEEYYPYIIKFKVHLIYGHFSQETEPHRIHVLEPGEASTEVLFNSRCVNSISIDGKIYTFFSEKINEDNKN